MVKISVMLRRDTFGGGEGEKRDYREIERVNEEDAVTWELWTWLIHTGSRACIDSGWIPPPTKKETLL